MSRKSRGMAFQGLGQSLSIVLRIHSSYIPFRKRIPCLWARHKATQVVPAFEPGIRQLRWWHFPASLATLGGPETSSGQRDVSGREVSKVGVMSFWKEITHSLLRFISPFPPWRLEWGPCGGHTAPGGSCPEAVLPTPTIGTWKYLETHSPITRQRGLLLTSHG